MTQQLRVALIGAGRAGMVHGRNFAAGIPHTRLVAVADPRQETQEMAARELGVERIFERPMDAATDDGIDAVVIATPTFTHAELAEAALHSGKHVLCEKPMASSLEDAARIEAAADRSSASFLMAFMRRFDEGFCRAAERINAGEIGEPVMVRSTGRGPGLPPEWAWDVDRSGGLAAEVNSHDIDTIRWLSGQEPRRVFAVGRAAKRPDIAERYPGFVDVLVASVEMSGGAVAQLDGACPADYGYDARVEVYGTEGTLLVGSTTAPGPLLVREDGAVSDPVRSWRTLFAEAYRAEGRHFVDVALGAQEPRTTARDGVRALATALAMNRSIASGEALEVSET